MPCQNYENLLDAGLIDRDGNLTPLHNKYVPQQVKANRNLVDENNKLTRMLCEAMKAIEHIQYYTDYKVELTLSRELDEWWVEHKKQDATRKATSAKSKRSKE